MTDQQPVKSTTTRRTGWIFAAVLSILMIGGLAGLLSVVLTAKRNSEGNSIRGGGDESFPDSSCPKIVASLNDQGTITGNSFEQFEDDAVMTPTCASDKDAMDGRYFEWKAPKDGQATLAAWTLLVEDTCECITTTSTFDVQEGQVIRVWTPVAETQPITFITAAPSDLECPLTVDSLDDFGMIVAKFYNEVAPEFIMPPACANKKDPTKGTYYTWKAAMDGQVTLAAWTFMVQGSACDCITSTSTFAVEKGTSLKVWVPEGETRPIEFTPQYMCPEIVHSLDESGFVTDGLVDQGLLAVPPSCVQNNRDPSEGMYFDWEATADGKATIAAWTVLVDPSTCDCITSPSTVNVSAGDVLRIWTPLDQTHPIEFSG